ncbi:hypothetical protein BJY52DRAFT_1418903 [Lactarius psammicola]|nr:hypothetical protein BJY52DRAFT_1418903 [Lactarius psammicola]
MVRDSYGLSEPSVCRWQQLRLNCVFWWWKPPAEASMVHCIMSQDRGPRSWGPDRCSSRNENGGRREGNAKEELNAIVTKHHMTGKVKGKVAKDVIATASEQHLLASLLAVPLVLGGFGVSLEVLEVVSLWTTTKEYDLRYRLPVHAQVLTDVLLGQTTWTRFVDKPVLSEDRSGVSKYEHRPGSLVTPIHLCRLAASGTVPVPSEVKWNTLGPRVRESRGFQQERAPKARRQPRTWESWDQLRRIWKEPLGTSRTMCFPAFKLRHFQFAQSPFLYLGHDKHEAMNLPVTDIASVASNYMGKWIVLQLFV